MQGKYIPLHFCLKQQNIPQSSILNPHSSILPQTLNHTELMQEYCEYSQRTHIPHKEEIHTEKASF